MPYNPHDKPTVRQLCRELRSVTDWESFAQGLPCIEERHIDTVEIEHHQRVASQKRAIFNIWLRVDGNATWSDVRNALVGSNYIVLADKLVPPELLQQPPTSQQPQQPPTSQQPQQPRAPQKSLVIILALLCAYVVLLLVLRLLYVQEPFELEEDTTDTIVGLHLNFTNIISEIEDKFAALVGKDSFLLDTIKRYAEKIVSPSRPVQFDVDNIRDLFRKLSEHYDFLDCKIIATIAEKFLQVGNPVTDLTEYCNRVEKFRKTETIQKLAEFLGMTRWKIKLYIKLQNQWGNVTIEAINVLIEHLLPTPVKKRPRYSLVNHAVIMPGCLLLQYDVKDEISINAIVQHIEHNDNLMRLIGVIELRVSDNNYANPSNTSGKSIIKGYENPSFSFNASLLDATEAGNSIAVRFLLDIGADVNYQNGEGDTALMMAVLVGDISMVRLLLEAGADVDMNGNYTALMLACGGHLKMPSNIVRLDDDYIDIVQLLLSYGADPLLENKDNLEVLVPISSFEVACSTDNVEIVELLLAKYNIPPEVLLKGLYWAFIDGAFYTIELLQHELLQRKLPALDPLVLKMGISCVKGDAETVRQLIEQEAVDPNVSIVYGLTPLILASRHGHIDTINMLLYCGADISKVDDILGINVFADYEENYFILYQVYGMNYFLENTDIA